MKAIVDPDACIGCELCPSICPEVYRMEGPVAKAIEGEVPKEFEDSAREAAESCPVEAIKITE